MVLAESNYGADLDMVTLAMRERIDLVKPSLPNDVSAPIIFKFDPAMMPIMMLGVGGGDNLEAATKLIDNTVVPRLKRIPGVASVSTDGGLVREFRVEVDQARLLAYGLTLSQIEGLLRAENLNLPGGTTTRGGTEYLVRSMGEFRSIEDLRNLRLSLPRGGTVALSDLAVIRDDYQEQTRADPDQRPVGPGPLYPEGKRRQYGPDRAEDPQGTGGPPARLGGPLYLHHRLRPGGVHRAEPALRQ